MKNAALAALLATALLAGCGGDDDKDKAEGTQTVEGVKAKGQDSEAKTAAAQLSTEVEACFIDTQDYSGCKEPEGSTVKPGAAEVSEADTASYTVTAKSASGTTFTLTKAEGGAVERTCEGGPEDGGCEGGKW